ncbi:MAG: hypothetical protein JSS00_01140 [Proteobacteria bacterium]|nr:hypothetical protein [Pseudomonadota bacterium]
MKVLISTFALLALSGCAGSYRDGSLETTDTFGRANAANIQTQAAAARSDQSTTDGEVVASAVDKYKHGDPPPTAAPAASRVGAGGN